MIVLPNFLGIGVPKAGTTWLYDLLVSHPHIWLPPQRKEVHYFTRNRHRGLDWYKQFFPDDSEGSRYTAIGEISPHYLYCSADEIEYIVRELPSITKFVLLLRNPVDRAYSHYWFRKRIDNLDVSFEKFLERHPHIIEYGRYALHLERWFRFFAHDQFRVLTFERMFGGLNETRQMLGNFLNVDPLAFPSDAGSKRSNVRFMPRYQRAYAGAVKVGRFLRQRDFYWTTELARQLKVKRWFGARRHEGEEPMKPGMRKHLRDLYAEDNERLERLLKQDFSNWI